MFVKQLFVKYKWLYHSYIRDNSWLVKVLKKVSGYFCTRLQC